MRDRRDLHVSHDPLRPGALVRTVVRSPQGIARAPVSAVVRAGGVRGPTLVEAAGCLWQPEELEVVRPPLETAMKR